MSCSGWNSWESIASQNTNETNRHTQGMEDGGEETRENTCIRSRGSRGREGTGGVEGGRDKRETQKDNEKVEGE